MLGEQHGLHDGVQHQAFELVDRRPGSNTRKNLGYYIEGMGSTELCFLEILQAAHNLEVSLTG